VPIDSHAHERTHIGKSEIIATSETKDRSIDDRTRLGAARRPSVRQISADRRQRLFDRSLKLFVMVKQKAFSLLVRNYEFIE
jgi:hypothetical protein